MIQSKTNISKHISYKTLSIQISLNGLSFCILNTQDKSVLKIEHVVFDKKVTPFELLDAVKHAFNTEEWLNEDFDNVQVIHVNELATLVPKPLFNEDAIADYLKLNSKILKTDFITFDSISVNETINVYVPYVNVNNYIYERFGDFTYKHYSTILVEEILAQEKNASGNKMYIHVDTTHFEIIVIKEGTLALYNTFEYHTVEDFIYYVLFTAEQLSLNPEVIETVLLGSITKDNAFYNILYKYVRHISFGSRKDNFAVTEDIKNNHSHFTLLTHF
ncbi:DUF3822 family protein [Lacinutrix sp. Bg11-31]|uniref:DUF3822 family protein n=1 Tax=Lacinutrix sp. Bg11-31 TaxID=2057808 RepID=UPI000C31A1EA|nr:DUF3822 family protein [Lacinutrix sp. Bg11-31]AUC83663.1 DUF3822 domain-containing protein [Lacinutrix sp. Bg11-31]